MSPESVDTSKQIMAELYSLVAPTYVEHGPPHFVYAGRRLVEAAGVQPGDAVLDLGTGRGAVLLPAAERVGPGGLAIGIDLAPGMVEHTQATLVERGLSWASAQVMDAEKLQFDSATFSHVLCSYAVFFFPDLQRVLAEVRRVLRANGVAGFAFERRVDPRWRWYEELLRARGALENLQRMPGDGTVRAPGVLVDTLRSAGFEDVTEQLEEVELGYANAETWWASLWTHGSRRALAGLPAAELAEIKAVCLSKAGAKAGDSGLPERHHFVYVTASS